MTTRSSADATWRIGSRPIPSRRLRRIVPTIVFGRRSVLDISSRNRLVPPSTARIRESAGGLLVVTSVANSLGRRPGGAGTRLVATSGCDRHRVGCVDHAHAGTCTSQRGRRAGGGERRMTDPADVDSPGTATSSCCRSRPASPSGGIERSPRRPPGHCALNSSA